ncbi:HEAT repeat domain-containing protein [Hugenholtzia roseola]|uniref:HEAT repeat domain-containing protein n=1 Tax=Hugenholtzia roseola TaxID=1002 RepID=UPI00047B61FA|nr:HEAT repeat domain-containing protein [Hugenholtzia roseola]
MSKKTTIHYFWRLALANVYLLNMVLRLLIWSGRRDWVQKTLPLLQHPNLTIRRLVVIAIRKYQLKETLPTLKQRYAQEPLSIRIQILKAIQNIGSSKEKGFLGQLSRATSKEEALWAIRALVRLEAKTLAQQQGEQASPFFENYTMAAPSKETPTF